jgi:hypothetical protein
MGSRPMGSLSARKALSPGMVKRSLNGRLHRRAAGGSGSRGPAGVEAQGMYAAALPRNLGGPADSTEV